MPFLFSKKMAVIKHILDIVSVCAFHGLKNVVIAPGSRSAALTIAFEKHPQFTCYSISDERVAAYTALGISLETNEPTILICTSGTAALNFASAVAEAYFLEIPLLVLTADRPLEWINQYDGQTIYQQNLFGKNVKKSFELLADEQAKDVRWFTQRVINESIFTAKQRPFGPIHINVPIREPFYPASNEEFVFEPIKGISFPETKISLAENEWEQLMQEVRKIEKIAIAIGQNFDFRLAAILVKIQEVLHIPIIADSISNVPEASYITQDLTTNFPEIDLLITLGKSFISKNLKLHFRNQPIAQHWHFQHNTTVFDPLQSVTSYFVLDEAAFFEEFYQRLLENKIEKPSILTKFFKNENELNINKAHQYITNAEFSDLKIVAHFLNEIEDGAILHVGNSMSIRYVNALSFLLKKSVSIYCNRGTSGIDGSLSTAVGQAMATTKQVYCLLGDVSFQYDKNALWNVNMPKNLKILILNNQGGNIFRMIPGPKTQTAYKNFFETIQPFTAKWIAKEFGVNYLEAKSEVELDKAVRIFISSKMNEILEVFTTPDVNEAVFIKFKQQFK